MLALSILINVLLAWRWYTVEQELHERTMLLENMEKHALELEKRLFALEQGRAETESESLYDELDSTLFDGWAELLKEFKGRVDEIQKQIERSLRGAEEAPPVEAEAL